MSFGNWECVGIFRGFASVPLLPFDCCWLPPLLRNPPPILPIPPPPPNIPLYFFPSFRLLINAKLRAPEQQQQQQWRWRLPKFIARIDPSPKEPTKWKEGGGNEYVEDKWG
jgi:hypothetical protein